MKQTTCRVCGKKLNLLYAFGDVPVANVFDLGARVQTHPLPLCICRGCGLVQLGYIVPPKDIFPAYRYTSSASEPLVAHLNALAKSSVALFAHPEKAAVLDIGANDGTFLLALGRRVRLRVGVDPASVVSKKSVDAGIIMKHAFFSARVARSLLRTHGPFDLIVATHTLANVVDLHDFFRGISLVLRDTGIVILEVGDVDTILKKGCFDSVYHEHYSYFSAATIRYLLSLHGFRMKKIEKLPMHGGSIRIVAVRSAKIMAIPPGALHSARISSVFQKRITKYKVRIKNVLEKYSGKVVIGFGAPSKAATLFHVAGLSGIVTAFVDSTPQKQGLVFPGTTIPIYTENYIRDKQVGAIILFSWNYAPLVLKKIRALVSGHTDVIIPFPTLRVVRV